MREAPNSIRGFVSTRVKYAMPIHEGARAHKIVPRRVGGRLLFSWYVVGADVSFRSVYHPCVGAPPFMTSAMRDACVPLGFTIIRTVDPSRMDANL